MEYQNQQLDCTERENQKLKKLVSELFYENKVLKQKLEKVSPGEVIPTGVAGSVKVYQKVTEKDGQIKESEFVVVEDDTTQII